MFLLGLLPDIRFCLFSTTLACTLGHTTSPVWIGFRDVGWSLSRWRRPGVACRSAQVDAAPVQVQDEDSVGADFAQEAGAERGGDAADGAQGASSRVLCPRLLVVVGGGGAVGAGHGRVLLLGVHIVPSIGVEGIAAIILLVARVLSSGCPRSRGGVLSDQPEEFCDGTVRSLAFRCPLLLVSGAAPILLALAALVLLDNFTPLLVGRELVQEALDLGLRADGPLVQVPVVRPEPLDADEGPPFR
mmetsp:Transcript_21203/g.61928  ORF Transcript_21203/g.61928 Transcript_21203/m.61928 type:complete len:245 (-) Transcript_21203:815-1549(-)